MNPHRVAFRVVGRPQPAGSKRAFIVKRKTGRQGVAVADDNPLAKGWKGEVASAAADAMGGDHTEWELLDGPLGLHVIFRVKRPRSHFRTGRNAGEVRQAAPAYPTVKPDSTKLLRAVEDALTGVVWRDDAQVVEQVVYKHYGEPEGASVVVWTL